MPRWPHRVVPHGRTCEVRERRGSLGFDYRAGDPAEYAFTVDIYAHREHTHPDRHAGWWRFVLPRGRGRGELRLDFTSIQRTSVALVVEGVPCDAIDAWWNPDFAFDPLGDVELVFRDRSNRIRRVEPVLAKYLDRDILREFYARHYANRSYRPPDDRPFLHELHARKLRVLGELFLKHIPFGGLAADVGCGRSLFADTGLDFPFTVVAGDLDFESVRDRAREVPRQRWGVFDASLLPFADASLSALFAGEVIEHVPDARATLREWARVLKSGGIAIITTPNRGRLSARLNRIEMPYSRDHLRELSYSELAGPLLRDAGFEFLEQHCLYLELALQRYFEGIWRVGDYLQRGGNRPELAWLMRRLFPLGRLAPHLSLAVVVVARKR